jgi:hypothetical protein
MLIQVIVVLIVIALRGFWRYAEKVTTSKMVKEANTCGFYQHEVIGRSYSLLSFNLRGLIAVIILYLSS